MKENKLASNQTYISIHILSRTLRKQKIIVLTNSFIRRAKYQLLNKRYASLYFWKINNAICFKFTEKEGNSKLNFRNPNNITFSCTSFLNYYDIEFEKKRSSYYVSHYHYPVEFENVDDRGKWWVVYLDRRIR